MRTETLTAFVASEYEKVLHRYIQRGVGHRISYAIREVIRTLSGRAGDYKEELNRLVMEYAPDTGRIGPEDVNWNEFVTELSPFADAEFEFEFKPIGTMEEILADLDKIAERGGDNSVSAQEWEALELFATKEEE